MHRHATAATLAVALATGLPTGPAWARPAPDPGSISRGERLAERNCAACHAVGRRGGSPNASAPPFRDLHRRYPADALEEAFRRGLLRRHPAMPEFRFLPREINDLTAYLKSLRQGGDV
jgi:mono/diheme cytochrome c family protein